MSAAMLATVTIASAIATQVAAGSPLRTAVSTRRSIARSDEQIGGHVAEALNRDDAFLEPMRVL